MTASTRPISYERLPTGEYRVWTPDALLGTVDRLPNKAWQARTLDGDYVGRPTHTRDQAARALRDHHRSRAA